MKDEKDIELFNWFGSSEVSRKVYWITLAILALIQIGLGISIFF